MPTATRKTHSDKRILSVKIRRVVDENPDTSYLGEYSKSPNSPFSIDRAHSEDCAFVSDLAWKASQTLQNAQKTVGDLQTAVDYDSDSAEWEALETAYYQLEELAENVVECDCGERGDMERGQYQFFNPSFVNSREEARYAHERMESLNRGSWQYIGIRAVADVTTNTVVQHITSGGLWGIESDSSRDYLESIERDELAGLKDQLSALGFSRRAIATAFRDVTEVR
jgi:hypothetical protein